MKIPFVKAYLTGNELDYIAKIKSYSGDGSFTRECHAWLEKNIATLKALLTHSCTAALEMTALLIDIQPGDEIIMPSYTFVSTANAFVLRGGIPVFIDIRSDTLNLDEKLIEAAITPRTKAIVPVHYAGVACEMDTILHIANKYNLYVIEDAAQGIMAKYKGRPLGSLGHFGALSFHATKNIISGEGGALLVNDNRFSELAEIIREKGTDRCRFFRGQVDKYTWQHVGSSYLPSELVAAFLLAQLEEAETITQRRIHIWNTYHSAFEELEKAGLLRRPVIPDTCQHNAHMYYILLPDAALRPDVIASYERQGILSVFHYVPLHSSPAGKRYGHTHGDLVHTNILSESLLRLPLFHEMTDEMINHIIDSTYENVSKFAISA